MLNHITIMGRLVRDPEKRSTGSGISVANFTVAVDRDRNGQDGTKETDFIDCVAWRQTADFVSKYFTKGRMIAVSGRLTISSFTDKDGNKRKKAEVVAENCYFADSKKDAEANGAIVGGGAYDETLAYANQMVQNKQREGYDYPYPVQPGASDYALLEDDDSQLPF